MLGVIPAAGVGSRIKPLAFSKELLPVGCRRDGASEHPRAVSEYLVDRLIAGGVDRLCFVIAPGKSDILSYYGSCVGGAQVVYVVQDRPGGLCDAVFRASAVVLPDEHVLIGLPDTIWFPEDGFCALKDGELSLLLFPVEHPEHFDAVVTDEFDRVLEVQVKRADAGSNWIWGAFKMPGYVFLALRDLWERRERADEYLGTLINAHLGEGHAAVGVRAGEAYVDVGTLHGYREAMRLLGEHGVRAETVHG